MEKKKPLPSPKPLASKRKPKRKTKAKGTKTPGKKSKAVVNRILDRIMGGESLRSICQTKGMPHFTTVLRWVRDDVEFFKQYIQAQEVQAEILADEVIELSQKATSKDNADAIRVRIDAVKWKAGKQKPKRFGDKLDLTSDGEKILGITYEILKPHDTKDSGQRDTGQE